MPYYLFFISTIFFFEIILDNWIFVGNKSNYGLVNISSKICAYYYLFIFWYSFKNRNWGKWVGYIFVTYVILSILYYTCWGSDKILDTVSYNVGILLTLPLVLLYLYEVIHKKVYYNVFKDAYFYFAFGILFFYTSAFPMIGFLNVLVTNNAQFQAYIDLLNAGNIFLNLAYLGAALCSTIPKQSTISS